MPRTSQRPTAASAYERAIRRLARRDHSTHELRSALLRAGHAEEEVEAALARLAPQLDDARFAARFARSRIQHRGQGQLRVRLALRQRGVDPGDAERGLGEALAEVSEAGVLDALARRYWRSHSADEPARRILKLRVHLLRRGFPAGLVAERLQALWPRWSRRLADLGDPLDEA